MIELSSHWTRQPSRLVGIDGENPLARGLAAAYLPIAGGWLDATKFANHALTASNPGGFIPGGRAGVGDALEMFGSGYGSQAGSSTPTSAAGFSAALWVKFASTPTSYGQHLTRAAGSGGDWELSNDGTVRKLAYARNGATLYSPTSTVDTEWHLWHWSIDAAGNGAWYTDGGLNSSTTGLTVRDANGAVYIGKRSDNYPCNSRIGTAYIWSRPTSAAEARELYRNEWRLFHKRPKRIFVSVAGGGGGVTGTAAITLGNDTSSAIGTTTVKGTAAPTLGNATSSATGVVGSVSGTAAITLGNDTSAAQGTTRIGGTGAVTLGNDTCSASGAVGSAITGTAAITLGNDTSSATGTTKILGSAAITLGSDFSTTQGTTKILGTAAITLGDDFATAFGTSGTPTTVSSPRGLTIRIGLAL